MERVCRVVLQFAVASRYGKFILGAGDDEEVHGSAPRDGLFKGQVPVSGTAVCTAVQRLNVLLLVLGTKAAGVRLACCPVDSIAAARMAL